MKKEIHPQNSSYYSYDIPEKNEKNWVTIIYYLSGKKICLLNYDFSIFNLARMSPEWNHHTLYFTICESIFIRRLLIVDDVHGDT